MRLRMSLGWSDLAGREEACTLGQARGRSTQVSLSCCLNIFPFILRPLLPLMETTPRGSFALPSHPLVLHFCFTEKDPKLIYFLS